MSAFTDLVQKIRTQQGYEDSEFAEACMTDGQPDVDKAEFIINEIFRPEFIFDVYGGNEEEQNAADAEKDKENKENGYDEQGNIIAPEIPEQWR